MMKSEAVPLVTLLLILATVSLVESGRAARSQEAREKRIDSLRTAASRSLLNHQRSVVAIFHKTHQFSPDAMQRLSDALRRIPDDIDRTQWADEHFDEWAPRSEMDSIGSSPLLKNLLRRRLSEGYVDAFEYEVNATPYEDADVIVVEALVLSRSVDQLVEFDVTPRQLETILDSLEDDQHSATLRLKQISVALTSLALLCLWPYLKLINNGRRKKLIAAAVGTVGALAAWIYSLIIGPSGSGVITWGVWHVLAVLTAVLSSYVLSVVLVFGGSSFVSLFLFASSDDPRRGRGYFALGIVVAGLVGRLCLSFISGDSFLSPQYPLKATLGVISLTLIVVGMAYAVFAIFTRRGLSLARCAFSLAFAYTVYFLGSVLYSMSG